MQRNGHNPYKPFAFHDLPDSALKENVVEKGYEICRWCGAAECELDEEQCSQRINRIGTPTLEEKCKQLGLTFKEHGKHVGVYHPDGRLEVSGQRNMVWKWFEAKGWA